MAVKMPIALFKGDPVGVAGVANGLGCNCVCLSCNVPVIARQGSQNQWHFAHADADTKVICEFSIPLSARRFAKHVFGKIEALCLPAFVEAPHSAAVHGYKLSDKAVRLPAQTIVPETITLNAGVNDVTAPVVVTMRGVDLAIYFSPTDAETRAAQRWAELGISVLFIDVVHAHWETMIDEERFIKYVAEEAPRSWSFHRKGHAMLQAVQLAVDQEYAAYQAARQRSELTTVQVVNTGRPASPPPMRIDPTEPMVAARVELMIAAEVRCFGAGGEGFQCADCGLVYLASDGEQCPFCSCTRRQDVTITQAMIDKAGARYRCYDLPRRSASCFPDETLNLVLLRNEPKTDM